MEVIIANSKADSMITKKSFSNALNTGVTNALNTGVTKKKKEK